MSVKAKANGITYTLAELTDVPTPLAVQKQLGTSNYSIVPAGIVEVFKSGNFAHIHVSANARVAMTAGTSYWVEDLRGDFRPVEGVYGAPVNGGRLNIWRTDDTQEKFEIRFIPTANIAVGSPVNIDFSYFTK